MGLSRKYARLSSGLLVAGIVALVAGFLPGVPVEPAAGLGLFIGFTVVSTIFQLLYLRCPYCSKAVISTRSSRRSTTRCPRCGGEIHWKD